LTINESLKNPAKEQKLRPQNRMAPDIGIGRKKKPELQAHFIECKQKVAANWACTSRGTHRDCQQLCHGIPPGPQWS